MLLDTHVLLWLLMADRQLGPSARRALREAASPAYISAASAWEIAIKVAAGRLRAPDQLLERTARAGLEWIPATAQHAWSVSGLRGLSHADPFDRLLVAQAAQEGLTLLTADRAIHAATLTPSISVLDARL